MENEYLFFLIIMFSAICLTAYMLIRLIQRTLDSLVLTKAETLLRRNHSGQSKTLDYKEAFREYFRNEVYFHQTLTLNELNKLTDIDTDKMERFIKQDLSMLNVKEIGQISILLYENENNNSNSLFGVIDYRHR